MMQVCGSLRTMCYTLIFFTLLETCTMIFILSIETRPHGSQISCTGLLPTWIPDLMHWLAAHMDPRSHALAGCPHGSQISCTGWLPTWIPDLMHWLAAHMDPRSHALAGCPHGSQISCTGWLPTWIPDLMHWLVAHMDP